MATCPKCGRYLNRQHSCWGGSRWIREAAFALTGAFAGFAAGLFIVEHPTQPFPFVTAALGGVLTLAVRRHARF